MIVEQYKKQFAAALAEKTGLEASEIEGMIELPPQSDMGDLAFPCFTLAKSLKKAPPMIANEIAGSVSVPWFSEVKALGPYVNAFIDKSAFVKSVLSATEQTLSNDQKVLLEYMG